MLSRKILTLGFGLTIGAVVLTGCTSGQDNSVSNLSFNDPSKLTSAPQWSLSSSDFLDDNWTIEAGKGEGETPNTIYATSSDEACSIGYSTTFLSSSKAGRGDEYLTQEYLYDFGEQQAQMAKLESKTVKSESEQDVEMFATSLQYDSFLSPDQPADLENTDFDDKNAKTDTRVLARVFDTTMDNGTTSETNATSSDIFNSDLTKGEPILLVTYSCNDQEIDEGTWNKVVSNAKVDLKLSTDKKE